MLRLPLLTALALGLSACASDAECGPITGTVPIAGSQASPALARITAEDARSAALVSVPGAVVTDVDLDEEDGFLVYEVELAKDRSGFEVVVDAGSGEVLCSERD